MSTSAAIGLAIFTFILGIVIVRIIDFIFSIEEKDERDDLIERSQRVAEALQSKLQDVKDKLSVVQEKYYDCQAHNTELQIKLDEKQKVHP